MKTRIEDKQVLCAISPQVLVAYAIAEGWLPSETYGAHSRVYVNGKNEVIIPGTSKLGDYAAVVSELLSAFSMFEGRSELQIYRDISTSDKDVVRVRLPDAQENGSIHIGAGVDLVVHARDLVLSAACSAWSQRAAYRAGAVKQADVYMNRVLMGQTEQGSFIVTLLAPVPPAVITPHEIIPDEPIPVEDEPYDRRVTRRLTGGLDAAAEAIERYNLGSGSAVFETAIKRGLSANMCEATASLGSREGDVEVSVTWARTRTTLEHRWKRTFTRSDSEMLLEVARHFRNRQDRPDEVIEGITTKLTREYDYGNGVVAMRSVIDGRYTSVKAELRPNDYDKAIQAHHGKHALSMTGTLTRVRARWWLDKPTDVHVVYDDEDDVADGQVTINDD